MTSYQSIFRFICFAILFCVCLAQDTNAQGFVSNGSFETGDFTSWVVTDNTTPFDPFMVLSSGSLTVFNAFGPNSNVVIPSDGSFAASNGFDGAAGTISLAQDVGIIAFRDILQFDYRAGWDLLNFSGPSNSDRSFQVLIDSVDGSTPTVPISLLTAMIGTDTLNGPNSDTGPLSAALNLTFFTGLDLRVTFVWTVPDDFSGPANAQLDNIEFTTFVPPPIPEPSSITFGLLGLVGMITRRRR